jgi:hypothetical protein
MPSKTPSYKARATGEGHPGRYACGSLTKKKANRVKVSGDPQEKHYLMNPGYVVWGRRVSLCREALSEWMLLL